MSREPRRYFVDGIEVIDNPPICVKIPDKYASMVPVTSPPWSGSIGVEEYKLILAARPDLADAPIFVLDQMGLMVRKGETKQ